MEYLKHSWPNEYFRTNNYWSLMRKQNLQTPRNNTYIWSVPLATEPGWLADRCSMSQQLGTLQTHTTDTFLFISNTTNVLLFKFRWY